MEWTVEHNQGTQGVNERTIETHTVEAADEFTAIAKVAGRDAARESLELIRDGGQSGKWVDYFAAYPSELFSH